MTDTTGHAAGGPVAGTLHSAYDDIARSVWLTFDAADDATTGQAIGQATELAPGWRLAFTSLQQLTPTGEVELVDRLGSYHLIAPEPAVALRAGARWEIGACDVSHRARHANDGPVSAYLVTADDDVLPVRVQPMTGPAALAVAAVRDRHHSITGLDDRPPLLPYPAYVDVTDPSPLAARGARLIGSSDAHAAWRAVADVARRRGLPLLDDIDGRDDAGVAVRAALEPRLGPEAYRLVIDGTVEIVAGDEAGLRHAFVTLAQWLADGLPARARVVDRPHFTWRGLHVDLARHWFEPGVVDRLIDDTAWRKLSRLHLHLTDDEGWRLPVARRPELSAAATRGHGLVLPPMLGDGPGATGRAYTADEIAAWVSRAEALGVVLVPEIDIPGHMHAALAAVPSLRDPDDRSDAGSVQYFVDNVLVPGVDDTHAFVRDVVDAVTELFPASPWIHVGGDEVPDGAWSRSPVARSFARRHDLTTTNEIEAAIHREVVDAILSRAGRAVGAWEEAARTGGARPGDGYVVGWRSVDASRELARRGFDVVAAPGQAYYVDMATDSAWSTPGMSWAGSTSLDDVCDFDPEAGWSAAERSHLLGIQACLWTEHVRDEADIHRQLFPRLDAIAERAWTGTVIGGAPSVARRSRAIGRS